MFLELHPKLRISETVEIRTVVAIPQRTDMLRRQLRHRSGSPRPCVLQARLFGTTNGSRAILFICCQNDWSATM
jgi:hypothetical protein